MKKFNIFLILTLILSLCLIPVFADVQTGIPAIINGLKTFTGGIVIKDPNTASINSTGDTRVHSLGINENADPNTWLITSPNLNVSNSPQGTGYAIIGKSQIGTLPASADYGCLSYLNLFDANNYALLYDNTGATFLNASTGKTISFQNNNANVASISSNGLTMAANKCFATGGQTADPNYAIKANGFTVDPNGYIGVGGDDGGYGIMVSSGGINSNAYSTNGGNYFAYGSGSASTSIDSFFSQARYSAEAAYPVYYSGRLRLSGTAWDTSGAGSSKTHNWTIENRPISGNPTSSALWFSCDPGTGSYSDKVNFGSDGSITAASDTDTTFTFGRGKIGGMLGWDDCFTISHYDNFNANYFGLSLTGSNTYLNAFSTIYFYRNGGEIANISSTGLTMAAGKTISSCNIEPIANDTYYIGKPDDDTPLAYKALTLKDTTNGKYYKIEVINGVLTTTDLTD